MHCLKVSHARDLKPGQQVILNYGVMCGAAVGVVVGHVTTDWGHHAEVIVRRDENGQRACRRETIRGTPVIGERVGWRPAYRYTVTVRVQGSSGSQSLSWVDWAENPSCAHADARDSFQAAGYCVTSTEIARVDLG